MQWIFNLIAKAHAWVFRTTGGRIGGRFGKAPVLLLTTAGRKTGRRRTTPLLYVQDGDSVVLVGSYGGNPRHPAWYLNLQKDPRCAVQTRRMKGEMRAEDVPGGPDRDRLWREFVAMYRGYANYEKKTTRVIPLVRLRKIA